jgi:hypothetical protein
MVSHLRLAAMAAVVATRQVLMVEVRMRRGEGGVAIRWI